MEIKRQEGCPRCQSRSIGSSINDGGTMICANCHGSYHRCKKGSNIYGSIGSCFHCGEMNDILGSNYQPTKREMGRR